MKKWFGKYLVQIWIIISGLFALIVHCLFSVAAPNEWLIAKWSAGDILTFISTMALGLLAVWQNKKFKAENDAAQKRLESLTKRANEISAINKIVEYESGKLSRLRLKTQNYINACSTEAMLANLSGIAHQPNDFKKIFLHIEMDNRHMQIRHCTIELFSELRTYPNNDVEVIQLISVVSKYSEKSIELIKQVRKGSPFEDIHTEKETAEKEFITIASDFISNRESLLNRVVFENLTLDQITALYGDRTNKNDD